MSCKVISVCVGKGLRFVAAFSFDRLAHRVEMFHVEHSNYMAYLSSKPISQYNRGTRTTNAFNFAPELRVVWP